MEEDFYNEIEEFKKNRLKYDLVKNSNSLLYKLNLISNNLVFYVQHRPSLKKQMPIYFNL